MPRRDQEIRELAEDYINSIKGDTAQRLVHHPGERTNTGNPVAKYLEQQLEGLTGIEFSVEVNLSKASWDSSRGILAYEDAKLVLTWKERRVQYQEVFRQLPEDVHRFLEEYSAGKYPGLDKNNVAV